MTGDEKGKADQGQNEVPSRQPIFLLPAAVTALCGLLVAIHLAKLLVLNSEGQANLEVWFAFFPVRLIDPNVGDGGWLPLLWTPLTYALLHQGWEHLLINVAWLAIFATPVANRYGAARMLALFVVSALAGAVAFAAGTLPAPAELIGASGGIAGLTGAAVRFMFQPVEVAINPESGERHVLGRRLASLRQLFANPTARFFSLTWIVLNGLVPLLPLLTGGQGVEIAWQAHLGGFFAGLLLVPLLERKRS